MSGRLRSFPSLSSIATSVLGTIHSLTAKTSPVGADEIVVADSAASWLQKRVTLTNLATLMGSSAVLYDSGHLGGAAASISTGTLATGYRWHDLIFLGRSADAGTADDLYLLVNADTTVANYRRAVMLGGGTTFDGASAIPMIASIAAGGGLGSTYFTAVTGRILFPETSGTFNKTGVFTGGDWRGNTTCDATVSNWAHHADQAAITSYTVKTSTGSNLVAGSRFMVLGGV